MRRGKEIAQGAHASMGALLSVADRVINKYEEHVLCISLDDDRIGPWLNGRFAKITLVVNSEEELVALHEKAQAAGLISCLITDSGFTEFNGVPTKTALAIGPDVRDKIDAITAGLKLY